MLCQRLPTRRGRLAGGLRVWRAQRGAGDPGHAAAPAKHCEAHDEGRVRRIHGRPMVLLFRVGKGPLHSYKGPYASGAQVFSGSIPRVASVRHGAGVLSLASAVCAGTQGGGCRGAHAFAGLGWPAILAVMHSRVRGWMAEALAPAADCGVLGVWVRCGGQHPADGRPPQVAHRDGQPHGGAHPGPCAHCGHQSSPAAAVALTNSMRAMSRAHCLRAQGVWAEFFKVFG